MFGEGQMNDRLRQLERHLKQENPVLLEVVGSFRELDKISRSLGFLGRNESLAARVPWWPLISVLGTYSSGKSTFINSYLDYPLQSTGNQAVDDKFTVMCFSSEGVVRTLPGLSLDADPRFPFYQIGEAIDEVATGEGGRIDAYLQLKTCPSEKLRGKIVIDSPGFDADAQRTSTLRITDHIIHLSDLVLVFFDARHPEAGSMHDTLEHLVGSTISRHDSSKFMYVLNQIDTTAREDNPEQVFAAWQRALAQHGLTAGRCYSIYDTGAAVPIDDPQKRARFETKRDADLAAIYQRIDEVGVERAYRIVGMLEHTARMLEDDLVPRVQGFMQRWRQRVLWLDGLMLALVAAVVLGVGVGTDLLAGVSLDAMLGDPVTTAIVVAVVLVLLGYGHFRIRKWAAGQVIRRTLAEIPETSRHAGYARAFRRNTQWWRTIFAKNPLGWSGRTARKLERLVGVADIYVQKLNDRYANPSGKGAAVEATAPESDDSSAFAPAQTAGAGEPVAAGTAPEPAREREAG